MKMNLQSRHFKADKKLIDFIQKKIDKLEVFYDKIIDAEVFLKVDNNSKKENKTVEFKVKVPKEVFFVERTSVSFEESATLCSEAMARMLRKLNDKEKDK